MKIVMQLVVGASTATLCAVSQAQVYQCPGKDGTKVFQQNPCPDGKQLQTKREASAARPIDPSAARLNAQQEYAVATQKLEIQIAIQERRAMVGMTEDQLVMAMGRPSHVNVSQYGGDSPSKQWVYRAGGADSTYVYTRDGVVTSIQWGQRSIPAERPSNLSSSSRPGRSPR